jgi:hypothetical protein
MLFFPVNIIELRIHVHPFNLFCDIHTRFYFTLISMLFNRFLFCFMYFNFLSSDIFEREFIEQIINMKTFLMFYFRDMVRRVSRRRKTKKLKFFTRRHRLTPLDMFQHHFESIIRF